MMRGAGGGRGGEGGRKNFLPIYPELSVACKQFFSSGLIVLLFLQIIPKCCIE